MFKYWIIVFSLLMSCSPTKQPPQQESVSSVENEPKNRVEQPEKESSFDTKKQVEPPSQDVYESGLGLLEEQGLLPLESVSGLRIRSKEFRVLSVRANLIDLIDGPIPTVQIQIAEQADYAQIIRCAEETIIAGPTGDELTQVLLEDGNASEDIFTRNNFWAEALDAGCQRISSYFTDSIFNDGSAKSGTWKYLVRSCVLQRRLNAAEGYSTDGCSPFVNASPPLEFFNERDYKLRTMFEELEASNGKLDQAWSNYRDLLTRSTKAYDTCAQKNYEGAVKGNERRKKLGLLVNSIPAGISLLAGGRKVLENIVKKDSATGKAGAAGIGALKWAGVSLGVGYIGFTVLAGAIKDGSEFDGFSCAEGKALDAELTRQGEIMDQYTLQSVRIRDDLQVYQEQQARVR